MADIIEKRRRDYSGLDADKASIPAAGKAVGDRYFATDTGISYFWDASNWIIIPLDVIVAGMLKTDAVETAKIKDLNVTKGKAELGFGRYVPRDVASADFAIGDFPDKDAWQVNGLDLSGIVPEGAVAVQLAFNIFGNAVNLTFQCRGNATTKAFNKIEVITQVASVSTPLMDAVVNIDADRRVDYFCKTDISAVGGLVLGWYI